MVPCIVEKCITYAVCKNKILIECPKLKKLMNHMEDNMPTKDMWSLIHDYLPEVLAVHGTNVNLDTAEGLSDIILDRDQGVVNVLKQMDKVLR